MFRVECGTPHTDQYGADTRIQKHTATLLGMHSRIFYKW
jgi:hypothetical protein